MESQPLAVTAGSQQRKVKGMSTRRIRGPSSSPLEVRPVRLPEHYTRVGAKLNRIADLVRNDVAKELPQVVVNALERALNEFLQDIRLGLQVEGSSSTRSMTPGHYGRRLSTEIKDPELAKRVAKNRRTVQKDIDATFLARRP